MTRRSFALANSPLRSNPWVAFRESQGHQVTFLANSSDANQVRGEIRRLAAAGGLRYLLLVGDAAEVDPEVIVTRKAEDNQDGASVARSSPKLVKAIGQNPRIAASVGHVPTRHVRARVNVRFGSEPHIATDNWYADLDDDGAPDLAVGRLTADTADEVSLMVEKILAYERSRDFGPWRRHLHFVAGLGGFGPLVDSVLETSAKNVIAAGLPAAYGATLTQASWSSPYYPDPRRFRESAQAGLNDGCLFWIYMGHGQRRELDQTPQAAPRFQPILEAADARALVARNGAPIACLFSCYAGAFDGPEDCLAEELLRAPGGPVAVLAGSRVTMPYAMTVLGAEMLDQCFAQQQATLGDALLAAKRALVAPAKSHSLRASLDAMAALLSPAPADLAAERQEHLAMFNLLGDPLLVDASTEICRCARDEPFARRRRAPRGRRRYDSHYGPFTSRGHSACRTGRAARRAAICPFHAFGSSRERGPRRSNAARLICAPTIRFGRDKSFKRRPANSRSLCRFRQRRTATAWREFLLPASPTLRWERQRSRRRSRANLRPRVSSL